MSQASVLLSCEAIGKAYGLQSLFSGLSFALCEGDRVGLVGPNGAGKSTFLKILAGVESPDSGTRAVRRLVRLVSTSRNSPGLKRCNHPLGGHHDTTLSLFARCIHLPAWLRDDSSSATAPPTCTSSTRATALNRSTVPGQATGRQSSCYRLKRTKR
jgi:energy-coupling factor transporter ATP-binding protein EcfA2